MTQLAQIIDDFAFLDEWEDRYRYVIELGKALPELSEDKRTADNKVQGCASQVWLVTHSELLAREVEQHCGVRARRVIRIDGATWIEGMRLTGEIAEVDD